MSQAQMRRTILDSKLLEREIRSRKNVPARELAEAIVEEFDLLNAEEFQVVGVEAFIGEFRARPLDKVLDDILATVRSTGKTYAEVAATVPMAAVRAEDRPALMSTAYASRAASRAHYYSEAGDKPLAQIRQEREDRIASKVDAAKAAMAKEFMARLAETVDGRMAARGKLTDADWKSKEATLGTVASNSARAKKAVHAVRALAKKHGAACIDDLPARAFLQAFDLLLGAEGEL